MPPSYPLPNLFRTEQLSVADALYSLAISKVLWRGEADAALRMLRQVRAYARGKNIHPRHVAWTRQFELEALIQTGRPEAAWRLVRKHLREGYPHLASKAPQHRVRRLPHFIRDWEIPAAYFSGRIKHATDAMESYLDWALKNDVAYEMRNDVFNGDENPTHHLRVTLFHLYRAAGRSLAEWPRWADWVRALHPGLLALCKIDREKLAADPDLMSVFHQRLRAAERERRPAFLTFGQRDLLEPKRKALARQRKAATRIHTKKQDDHAAMLRRKRAIYFPWLDADG